MQYMLLVYEPERLDHGAEGQASLREVGGKHMALAKAMREAGVMKSGDGLQGVATATTVRTNEAADEPIPDERLRLIFV